MIKIVKKWSLEGIWHWLRFKTAKRQRTRQYMFKGKLVDVQRINDYELIFKSRSWYSLIVGVEQS